MHIPIMKSKESIQWETIELALKEPIEEVCYMVSFTWWTEWSTFVNQKEKKAAEPEMILNMDLVTLDRNYEETISQLYDQLASSAERFNDWEHMELKPSMKEGVDYVLIGEKVWNILAKKYPAWPVIIINIVANQEKSVNYLHSPYKGGYPDLSPGVLRYPVHVSLMGFTRVDYIMGFLFSLNATSKQLYDYTAKYIVKQEEFSIQYSKITSPTFTPGLTSITLPSNDSTLHDLGLKSHTSLKFMPIEKPSDILELTRTILSRSGDKHPFTYKVLHEEIFEGIEDDDESVNKEEMKAPSPVKKTNIEHSEAKAHESRGESHEKTLSFDREKEAKFGEQVRKAEAIMKGPLEKFEVCPIDRIVRSLAFIEEELEKHLKKPS